MSLEEVDHVQLLALAQCGISVPKTIKSARDFTPDVLNSVVVRALRLIVTDDASVKELPEKLPANVAARHRIATALAAAIKAQGYSGEGGYNQLLYPNEKEVRRLLSWLVSRLPRAEDAAIASGSGQATRAVILRSLRAWSAGISADGAATAVAAPAELLHGLASHDRLIGQANAPPARGRREAAGRAVWPAVAAAARADAARQQPDGAFRGSLAQSEAIAIVNAGSGPHQAALLPALDVAVAAARSAMTGTAALAGPSNPRLGSAAYPAFEGTKLDSYPSAFQRHAVFGVKVVRGHRTAGPKAATTVTVAAAEAAPRLRTEEEVQADREAEMAALQTRLDEGQAALDELASRRTMLDAALPILQAQLAAATSRASELETSYLARKAALDMLPQADQHIARLQGELDAGMRKMLALAAEWEGHRGPLAAAIEAEEAKITAQAQRADVLSTSIATMRQQLSDTASSYSVKEEQAQRLAAELNRLQQAMAAAAQAAGDGSAQEPLVTRPVYGRRINDIVRQIRKQKGEIAKIVADVRSAQSELNTVQEQLHKVAATATAAFERAAVEHPKDSGYRNALRQLISLQDLFSQLMACVTAMGAAENETRILENRAEQMRARNDAENTAALVRDITVLKQENAALAAQVATGAA